MQGGFDGSIRSHQACSWKLRTFLAAHVLVLLFQDHRITLFGNFFNSDVIDEGGSDPVFGEAMGEGTVYIPCEEETGPRELIVRVMDYDWGKRDDLLGRAIDGSMLVP